VKPEPDRENAEKTARQDDLAAAETAKNREAGQQVAGPESPPAADTSDAGSPDAKMKELPPST
jgi:hypothetical protein